jgi:hypothetical protein
MKTRSKTLLIAPGDIVRRPTDRAQGVVQARQGVWSVLVKWPSGQIETVRISELIRVV